MEEVLDNYIQFKRKLMVPPLMTYMKLSNREEKDRPVVFFFFVNLYLTKGCQVDL